MDIFFKGSRLSCFNAAVVFPLLNAIRFFFSLFIYICRIVVQIGTIHLPQDNQCLLVTALKGK